MGYQFLRPFVAEWSCNVVGPGRLCFWRKIL